MTVRPRPGLPALVAAVVAAVLAAACGGDLDVLGGRVQRRDLGAGAVTAEPPAELEPPVTYLSHRATPCPFPAQAAHGLTVECSELVVPMSRQPSSGEGAVARETSTVTLAVARVKSRSPSPRPDPVVYLEGGPGGSAISSIDFWTGPPAPFLDHRDLILVDQRGTGYSTPRLTCEQLTDDLDRAAAVRFTEDCVQLLHNEGVDLEAFDTTESAADLYDLRKALKISEWNLFGISYGTRLALWTLHTQPWGIRSIVLDSVYPPGTKLVETVGDGFLRAVRAVAADCAVQPACAGAHPDLEGELVAAIDRLDAGGSDDGDAFALFLFESMYATSVAPVVPRAIGLAAAGRLDQAVSVLRAARTGLAEDASPGIATRPHMSEALYQSVECAETAPTTSPGAVRAAGAALPASVARPFVAMDLRLLAVCNVWKVSANPLEQVHSDRPALVLAGAYDPITPPAWAEAAAATLPRARYQLVQGAGHGTWLAGDCPKARVSAFLEDPAGELPDCAGAAPAFTP